MKRLLYCFIAMLVLITVWFYGPGYTDPLTHESKGSKSQTTTSSRIDEITEQIRNAQADAIRNGSAPADVFEKSKDILSEEIEAQKSSQTISTNPPKQSSSKPDPYYYDEYGIRYKLVEGTSDEYYLDEDYEIELETPESSAFTSIGYRPYNKELWVVFRNSGVGYHYYDVEPEVWYSFKTADSKGSFFNEEIKGYYEYDRD